MSRLSKRALLVFVLATLAGACLHFVHALFPNVITALFSPVNESLWEHLKILYWPCLLSALLLTRGGERGELGARCFSMLAASAAMLAVGYLYHIVLDGDSLAFDIALYVLLMAAAFLLPCFLRRPCWGEHRDLLLLLVIALGAATVLFTFLPPGLLLFADLSGANTWSVLPC